MEADELAAEDGEAPEEIGVAGEGHAGEVDFEEFGVAGAVGRRMEDGVDVVEDVFGAESGWKTRGFVGVEGEV